MFQSSTETQGTKAGTMAGAEKKACEAEDIEMSKESCQVKRAGECKDSIVVETTNSTIN